jgi:hypothetical protein
MNKKFLNDPSKTKELSFLISFLNHCRLTGSPTQSANATDLLDNVVNVSNLYNNANTNLINTLQTVSPTETKENLEKTFQNVGHFEYVNLLISDRKFSDSMRNVLDAYQTGELDLRTLSAVITSNMTDIYGQIFQRVQAGENLTGEDIKKLIKSGLASKGKDIEKETMLLTDAGFKIPQVAIEQRMKGIKWQPIKGGSLPLKDIEKIKRATNTIRAGLEQTRSALQTAKSIAQIIRVLESVYTNGAVGILSVLLKKIMSFMRDIGSTGFYVLDMFEPYFLERGYYQKDSNDLTDEEKKDKNLLEAIKLREKISESKIFSNHEYIARDLYSSVPRLSNFTVDDYEKEKTKTETEGKTKIIDDEGFFKKLYTFYRPTTYAQWIRTITDAFMDENDLPDENMLGSYDNFKKPITDFFSTDDKDYKKDLRGYIKRQSIKNFEVDFFDKKKGKNLRTGRPVFGDTSTSNVIIVAFSAPDFINLATTVSGGVSAIVDFFRFLGAKNFDLPGSFKPLEKFFGGRKKRKKLYEFLTKPPYLDENGNVQVPNDISQYPDFSGASFRGIFPRFFEDLDQIETELNRWLKDFKSSFAKSINRFLNEIDEMIDDLEDFIDLLDNIIKFFEALQTMGLYTLNIISNGGNEDIVEKLLAAEGFPGVEEGDKLRFIGGFVVCYGAPNLELNGFDFADFVKQKTAMMGYQTEVEKFSATGDPDDDPGSFQDYIFEAGIDVGNKDYNSSLDKIFKKIF